MTPRSATGRSLLLAGTFAGLCAIAWPATAQQPAEPAAPIAPTPAAQAQTPPPSWQQGRSENVTEGMTKLAPAADSNGGRQIADRETQTAQGL